MALSALDQLLWAANFSCFVALLCVLIYRQRWKEIPVFTTLIAYDVAKTIALFLAFRTGSRHLYAAIYWSAAYLDFCLQLGVVIEMARIVLRPTGTWVQDAKKQFVFWGSAGAAVAAVLAWAVSPPSARALERWEMRGNLFTVLVICELVTVITITSNKLGLGWRSHVMALGQGLAAWSVVAVAVEVLHSYLGKVRAFLPLEHVLMVASLGTLGYWMVRLWQEEPVRQPISSDLQAYILALHRRVRYDVRRITN